MLYGARVTEAVVSSAPAGRVVPRRKRWATITSLTGAAVISLIVLGRLAPFGFGLPSLALYAAPVIVAILAARATRKIPVARDRLRVLGKALAILAGLLMLAVPFGYFQRAVAPVAWMTESGIPSRAYLQVITIPGMTQEPYEWDARPGRLIAYFDAPFGPGDPGEWWAAIETVSSLSANPCATLDYPDGDAQEPEAATCAKAGPGLWTLTTHDGAYAGFVRRADGVTITLTGFAYDRAALHRAIMAAHRAGDAELWPRIGAARVNLLFL